MATCRNAGEDLVDRDKLADMVRGVEEPSGSVPIP